MVIGERNTVPKADSSRPMGISYKAKIYIMYIYIEISSAAAPAAKKWGMQGDQGSGKIFGTTPFLC